MKVCESIQIYAGDCTFENLIKRKDYTQKSIVRFNFLPNDKAKPNIVTYHKYGLVKNNKNSSSVVFG